jgi:hypothetical protein
MHPLGRDDASIYNRTYHKSSGAVSGCRVIHPTSNSGDTQPSAAGAPQMPSVQPAQEAARVSAQPQTPDITPTSGAQNGKDLPSNPAGSDVPKAINNP